MIKRFLHIILFTVCIIAIAIGFFVNNYNFGLGSNMKYYNTAFENQGSVWYNDANDLFAEVVKTENKNIMVITSNSVEQFILQPLGYFEAELFEYSNTYNLSKLKQLYTYEIKYIKRFGKIIRFVLYSDGDNVLADTDEKLLFKLQ